MPFVMKTTGQPHTPTRSLTSWKNTLNLKPSRVTETTSEMQTKTQSMMESCVNVAVGYGVAVLSQVIIFRCYGIAVEVRDNLVIGVWFTLVSLVRSYALRRFFNRIHSGVSAHGTRK